MTQPGGSQTTPRPSSGEPSRGSGRERRAAEPAGPPKGWPLWVWPFVAVAAIAVAGYWLGIAGALTTAASAVAALIFIAGDFLYSGQRRRAVAVVALSLGVIVLTILLWQGKIPWIRLRPAAHAVTPGPVDLRGMTITQAQATKLNLRGAQLSGAILNRLTLRHKQMEGVIGSGASFRHVDLTFASLRGADLNGTDFSYACLIGTDFTGALLDGADVSHAILDLHSLPRSVVKKLTGAPIKPRAHQIRCPNH